MTIVCTVSVEFKIDLCSSSFQCPDMEGVVNEDLPNSWECPKCCKEGKNVEYRVSGLVFVIPDGGSKGLILLLPPAVVN
jgi:hypothetical protein